MTAELHVPALLLARLRTQLSALPALLDGVARDRLDRRASGKWSATENVAHLARYHEIWIDRIRRILAETGPTFPPYRAEEDPEWPAWQSRTFEQSLHHLHAGRAALVAVVDDLTPEQWARTGRHSRFGALSLRTWLEFFLAHEGHHLYLIMQSARTDPSTP